MDDTSQSNEWVTWINLKKLEFATNATGYGTSAEQNGADYYGNGKHYLNVQKLNGNGDSLNMVQAPGDFCRVWLTAQKISATNTFIQMSGNGFLWADVEQFEDNGSIGSKLDTLGGANFGAIDLDNGATARIRFVDATMTNANGKAFIAITNGATLRLIGGTITTSNNAAAIPCVVGTGGNLFL